MQKCRMLQYRTLYSWHLFEGFMVSYMMSELYSERVWDLNEDDFLQCGEWVERVTWQVLEGAGAEREGLGRYRGLLFLMGRYPQVKWVPSREIDAVVHLHAELTGFERGLGGMVEHSPGLGRKMEERSRWLAGFEQTRVLFERHFGLGAMGDSEPACCEVFEGRVV